MDSKIIIDFKIKLSAACTPSRVPCTHRASNTHSFQTLKKTLINMYMKYLHI